MTDFDFDPMAEDPYDRLDLPSDPTAGDIRLAAIKARAKYDPDGWPSEKKEWAETRLFRMREAIEAVEPGGGTGRDDTTGGSDDTTSESDEPRTVRLDLSAETRTETPPAEIAFTVTGETGAVPDVSVSAPGADTDTTGADGTATLSFDAEGEYTVVAERRSETEDVEYISDSVTVELERAKTELSVETDSDVISPSASVAVEVSDESGDLVPGVQLETSRGTEYSAPSGRTRLSFDDPGEVEITARKEDTDGKTFVPGTTSVTVEPSTLVLDANRTIATFGEEIKFVVRSADDDRVSGATVSGGDAEGKTDRYGICRLTPTEIGECTFRASTDGDEYEEATLDVEIEPREVDLSVEVDATEVSPSETLTVEVVDDDGPVDDATVETSRGKTHRAPDGEVSLSFDEPGDVELVGKKSDTDGVRYSSGETTITVVPTRETGGDEAADSGGTTDDSEGMFRPMEEERGITLERETDRVKAGESIRFSVTDADGEPVDAELEVEENGETQSADGGEGEITFETATNYTVVASATRDGETFTDRVSVRVDTAGPDGGDGKPPEPDKSVLNIATDKLSAVKPRLTRLLLLGTVIAAMGSLVAPSMFGTEGLLIVLAMGVLLVGVVFLTVTTNA